MQKLITSLIRCKSVTGEVLFIYFCIAFIEGILESPLSLLMPGMTTYVYPWAWWPSEASEV